MRLLFKKVISGNGPSHEIFGWLADERGFVDFSKGLKTHCVDSFFSGAECDSVAILESKHARADLNEMCENTRHEAAANQVAKTFRIVCKLLLNAVKKLESSPRAVHPMTLGVTVGLADASQAILSSAENLLAEETFENYQETMVKLRTRADQFRSKPATPLSSPARVTGASATRDSVDLKSKSLKFNIGIRKPRLAGKKPKSKPKLKPKPITPETVSSDEEPQAAKPQAAPQRHKKDGTSSGPPLRNSEQTYRPTSPLAPASPAPASPAPASPAPASPAAASPAPESELESESDPEPRPNPPAKRRRGNDGDAVVLSSDEDETASE